MGERGCPACGAPTYKRHCKLVCEGCGVVVADCSDPFRF
jgi:hypothetical protein